MKPDPHSGRYPVQFVPSEPRETPELADPEWLRRAADRIRRRAGRVGTDPDSYYGLFTPPSGHATAALLDALAADMQKNIGYPGPGWAEALLLAREIEKEY